MPIWYSGGSVSAEPLNLASAVNKILSGSMSHGSLKLKSRPIPGDVVCTAVTIAFDYDTDGILFDTDSEILSLSFPNLTSISKGTIGLQHCSKATAFSAPLLATVTGATSQILLFDCALLASIDLSSLTSFAGTVNFSALPALLSLDLSALTSCPHIELDSNTGLLTATIGMAGAIYEFWVVGNTALTSLIANAVVSCSNQLTITGNTALTTLNLDALNGNVGDGATPYIISDTAAASLSLPGLTILKPNFQIINNSNLTSLSIANLASIADGAALILDNNPLLADITVGASIATVDFLGFTAIGCALTTASVDAILAAFNAGKGAPSSGPTIDLSGGTNGVPTGGLLNPDYVALTGAGYSVNINT